MKKNKEEFNLRKERQKILNMYKTTAMPLEEFIREIFKQDDEFVKRLKNIPCDVEYSKYNFNKINLDLIKSLFRDWSKAVIKHIDKLAGNKII